MFLGSLPFQNSVFSCLKNMVLAASNSMVSYVRIYVVKETVPESDVREQGLGSAVIKLVCATVTRYGCHVICIDRLLSSVKCADYLSKNNMYQTGTLMKKRSELRASKLGDCKGFK